MQILGLFLAIVIIFCFDGNCYSAQKVVPPVQSTQGLEPVPVKKFDSVKQSIEEKNEQKAQENRLKKSRRIKKQIERQDKKKTKMQKELEYYEARLENTKSKLDILNPTSGEKGENQ